MDVDGNFVAGGRSEDTSLTTAPSPIVVYTSQYNYYKWAKQIQGTYDHVQAVKFNADGYRAVISMDTAPLLLIIINTADGSIVNAYKDNAAQHQGIMNGGLLFPSSNYLYLAIRRSTNDWSFAILQMNSGVLTNEFYIYRQDGDSQSYSLAVGRNGAVVFVGGYFKDTAQDLYHRSITAINPYDGPNLLWTFTDNSGQPLGDELYFSRLAYSTNHLFGCTESKGTPTAKIQVPRFALSATDHTVSPTASPTYEHGQANAIMRCIGMFAASDIDVALLIVDNTAGSLSYARADFTTPLSATLAVIPIASFSTAGTSQNHAVLTAMDQAFYVGSTIDIDGTYTYDFPVGYIMSFDPALSCMQLAYTQDPGTFTHLGATLFTDDAWPMQINTFTLMQDNPNWANVAQGTLVRHCPCGKPKPPTLRFGWKPPSFRAVRDGATTFRHDREIFTNGETCSDSQLVDFQISISNYAEYPPEVTIGPTSIRIDYPRVAYESDFQLRFNYAVTFPGRQTQSTPYFRVIMYGCSRSNLNSVPIATQYYMVSRETLTIPFQPFNSQLVGCLVTYTFFDVDNANYDQDLLTFDPIARTIDVYSLDDTKAREYNLRVRGRINAGGGSSNADFMLVVFPLDPCFDRAVGPLATNDYTHDIGQPNIETITELTADQVLAGCQTYEIQFRMDDGQDTMLDPTIFTSTTGTLEIQTSEVDAIKDYPLKVTTIMPGYPGFTHDKQFVVSVVNSCANPTITGAVTETQRYLIKHSPITWNVPPTVRAHDYCTYTFTYTASLESGRSLPQFIQFDNDNKQFTVFTKDDGLAGLYKIRLNAFVNDVSQTPAGSAILNLNLVEIKYAVKENTAPYFREPLKELSVDSGSSILYILPEIVDDEGDQVEVTVQLGSALPFVTYDQNSFQIKPKLTDVGFFPILIILSDSNIEPITISEMLPIKSVDSTKDQTSSNDEQITDSSQQDSENELKAKIQSISFSGFLSIQFDKEIGVPENFTLFDEKVLELSVIPSKHADPSKLKFTWTFVDWKPKKITIQLKFENPLEVSSADVGSFFNQLALQTNDIIAVKFKQDKYFYSPLIDRKIKKDSMIKRDMPPLMNDDLMSKFLLDSGSSFQKTLQAVVYGNFIVNLVLSKSLQLLWGMINALQLIVNLPLLRVNTPANALFFYSLVIEIVKFGIMSPNSIQNELFQADEKEPIHINFSIMDIFKNKPIQKLQTLILPQLTHSTILTVFQRTSTASTQYSACWDLLGQSCVHQSVLQRYPPGKNLSPPLLFSEQVNCSRRSAGFCSITQFQDSCSRSTFSLQSLQPSLFTMYGLYPELNCTYKVSFNSTRGIIDSSFTLFFASLISLSPLVVLAFILRNYKQLDKEKLRQRYVSLYAQVKVSSKGPLLYSFIYLTRRLSFAIVSVFCADWPFFQVLFFLIQCTLYTVYVIEVKPFAQPILNYLELFNEFCVSAAGLHLLIFSSYVTDVQTKYNAGWSIIALTLINMLLNMAFLFYKSVTLLKDQVLKLREKCRQKKIKKYQLKEEISPSPNQAKSQRADESLNEQDSTDPLSIRQNNFENSKVYQKFVIQEEAETEKQEDTYINYRQRKAMQRNPTQDVFSISTNERNNLQNYTPNLRTNQTQWRSGNNINDNWLLGQHINNAQHSVFENIRTKKRQETQPVHLPQLNAHDQVKPDQHISNFSYDDMTFRK